MVRLVFRPYTQLRRSICTSESLRTSTRVSPGFVLARHRSPSFGSQRVRSRFVRPTRQTSSPRGFGRPGVAPALFETGSPLADAPSSGPLHFHCASRVSLYTRRLAHMLDSLVRVSRRVGWDPTSTLRSGPRRLDARESIVREETGHDRAVLLDDAALVEEPKPQNSLTNAPYSRHPVGRGVLLGPPLADLGAANAVLSQRSSRQFRRSLAAKRACNQVPGAGTRSTFEGPPV